MIRVSISLFLLFFSCVAHSEVKLTHQNVSKFLEQMISVVNEKDADKLISFFSSDAKIHLDLPDNLGSKMELSLEKYKKILKFGWGLQVKSFYEVRDIEILINNKENTAIVKDLTIEHLENDGKIIIASVAEETLEIVILNGKPKIISLYAKIRE